MEKKFKNKQWFVSAESKPLIIAFIQEITQRGFPGDKELPTLDEQWNIIGVSAYSLITNGSLELKGWQLYGSGYNPQFKLPQDWDKALQYASEEEEVVPEYIEVTGTNGRNPWYEEHSGKIFKTTGLYPQGGTSIGIIVEGHQGLFIHHGNYKPSTKEAYEKQQNAPKYKVGDFLLHNDHTPNLRYIRGIHGNKYIIDIYYEIGTPYFGWTPLVTDIDPFHYRVSDEFALNMLKKHHAQQGIVEGAKCEYAGGSFGPITGFNLVKAASLANRNFTVTCGIKAGDSQLAIYSEKNFWITPTTDKFKVLPKEVKVAGYKVEKVDPSIVRIGCERNGKHFTKDSLIAIRDLIIHGIQDGGRTGARFQLSDFGIVNVTVNELNEAIKLFDQ